MIKDYFISLSDFTEFVHKLNNKSLGKNIVINGINDFDLDQSFDLAIFSINDLEIDSENLSDYSKKIRKKIYSLYTKLAKIIFI